MTNTLDKFYVLELNRENAESFIVSNINKKESKKT